MRENTAKHYVSINAIWVTGLILFTLILCNAFIIMNTDNNKTLVNLKGLDIKK